MIKSQRHAVNCRCVLQQHKSTRNPPNFAFPVCSLVVDGTCRESFAECPNCGVLHHVIDICKSVIVSRAELTGATPTAEDIKTCLPERLAGLLSSYELDISSWQHAQNIIEHNLWGDFIVLKREKAGESHVIKLVRILSDSLYKVETQSGRDTV